MKRGSNGALGLGHRRDFRSEEEEGRAGLAGLGPGSAQWLALLFFFVLKPFLISVL
jgi:hypothetical protein